MALNYSPATGYGTKVGNQYFVQTPTGGTWSSTPASTMIPSKATLGASKTASTAPVSTGGSTTKTTKTTPDNSGQQPLPTDSGLTNQINDLFNPSYDYLNQAEGQLRSDLPNVLNAAQANFDTNKSQLDASNTQATNQLDLTGTQAGQRNEEALAANRRLYSDLGRGYQQRFGGSTSAGQAASEIANVEQQRQMGQTQRGYADTINQINMQKQNVEAQHQASLLQLQQAKQTAIDQANRDFQQKLLDISKSRADLGTSKAQANLQALQDLRNKVFQINLQNQQFNQTLEAQKQASQMNLQQYAQYAQQGVQGGEQNLGAFVNQATTNPQTNLQVQAGGAYPGMSNQYTGQISQRREDPMTGLVGPINTDERSQSLYS